MEFIRSFFSLPVLGSFEQTERAQMFHRVILVTTAVLLVMLLLLGIELPASLPRRLQSITIWISLCLILIPLNRRGQTRLASWLAIWGLTLLVFVRVWTSGGIMAPAIGAFIVIILMAGVLLDRRGGVLMAVCCLAYGLAMVLAHGAGWLPAPRVQFSAFGMWLNIAMWLGLAMVLQSEVARSLGTALRRAEAELAERRQADAALRDSEERFRSLIENAPTAVRVSRQGITIYANQKFRELFGFDRADELVGKSAFEQWTPESRAAVMELAMRRERSREGTSDFGLEGLRKDGSRFPIEVSVASVELPDGPASFATITDITARKQTESERTSLIQELTHQNQDLNQFTYIISHNLRAPVANLIGLIELLGPEFRPDFAPDPETRQILGNLALTAHKLDDVIRDLNKILGVRHLREGHCETVNLAAECASALETLSLRDPDIARWVSIELEVPEVHTIKAYLQSMLYNLLSNAVKYRHPERTPQIRLHCWRDAEMFYLEVSDNGLGIDLDLHQDKVFKLYKRFHQHLEGRGLGLYLVKTQAEALGGGVKVESRPNQGTSFTVSLRPTPDPSQVPA